MNRLALAFVLPLCLGASTAFADAPSPDAAPPEPATETAPRLQNIFVPPRPIVEVLAEPAASQPKPDQPNSAQQPPRKRPALFAGGVATAIAGTLVFAGSMMVTVFKRTDQTANCNQILGDSQATANCQAGDQPGITAGNAGMVVGAIIIAASVPMLVIGSQRAAPIEVEAGLGAGSATLRGQF